MRGLSLVLVTVLAVGCAQNGGEPSGPWARATEVTTADDQAEVVHALAEATATAIAPAVTPGPGDPPEPIRCGGEEAPGDQAARQYTSSETRAIPIGDRDPGALVASTRSFWEEQGVEDLRTPGTDKSASVLVGSLGRLDLSLTIFDDRALVVLEVSGACLPRNGQAPAEEPDDQPT